MKKNAIVYLIVALVSFLASPSYAQVAVGLSVRIAPPVLPVYAQPVCPGDGYLWVPGYWAYGVEGYYWVPGVWMLAPVPGYLWTPGYWGFFGGYYGWHAGYWGEHIGFYGGVNYGYGYGGVGFVGGRWEGRTFRYNTAVMNINTTIVHNTYVDRTVVRTTANRTSFNGPGGILTRPTSREQVAGNERHLAPTMEQSQHQANSSKDRSQFVAVNHGRPSTAAMSSVKGTRFTPEGHTVKSSPAVHSVAEKQAPARHSEAPKSVAASRVERPAKVEHPIERPRVTRSAERVRSPQPEHVPAPHNHR